MKWQWSSGVILAGTADLTSPSNGTDCVCVAVSHRNRRGPGGCCDLVQSHCGAGSEGSEEQGESSELSHGHF